MRVCESQLVYRDPSRIMSTLKDSPKRQSLAMLSGLTAGVLSLLPMGADLLILTVYLICVIYVLYQMALSIKENIEIVLDGKALESAIATQLERQTLYRAKAQVIADGSLLSIAFLQPDNEQEFGQIGIGVFPQGKLPLRASIDNLQVSFINTLPEQQLFINWDSSSLSVQGSAAQRAIRKAPGEPVDLFQQQVMTVVNPGQRVNVAVTSEKLFRRPPNQIAMETKPTLIDVAKMPELKEVQRTYSLQIVMWVQLMNNPDAPGLQLLLPFNFRINLLADNVFLLSWLFDFFSPQPKQKSR